MLFYLGTHIPSWLGKTDVPLFVSHRRLTGRKSLPRAKGRWALDSGGFSELSLFGRWTVTAREYVDKVRRYDQEIGGMDWAAVQDWMCEPPIRKKTGLSTQEHQRRTVRSYLTLRDMAPEIPWAPVLQGWEPHTYFAHADMYQSAGVDLKALPVVGLGSVCRRQNANEIGHLASWLSVAGIKIHGFGVKTQGLRKYSESLTSADSLAWSYNARYTPLRLEGHTHKNCANCLEYALMWRSNLLGGLAPKTKPHHGATQERTKTMMNSGIPSSVFAEMADQKAPDETPSRYFDAEGDLEVRLDNLQMKPSANPKHSGKVVAIAEFSVVKGNHNYAIGERLSWVKYFRPGDTSFHAKFCLGEIKQLACAIIDAKAHEVDADTLEGVYTTAAPGLTGTVLSVSVRESGSKGSITYYKEHFSFVAAAE